MIPADKATILYTPRVKHKGRFVWRDRIQGVKVIQHPDSRWKEPGWYPCWCPATGTGLGAAPKDYVSKVTVLLNIFNQLVVRDGLDPKLVHTELLKIREYAVHWENQA